MDRKEIESFSGNRVHMRALRPRAASKQDCELIPKIYKESSQYLLKIPPPAKFLTTYMSSNSGRKDKAAFARLGSDMIFHVVNNTIDVLRRWKGDFVSLQQHYNYQSNFGKSQALANTLPVTCSPFSNYEVQIAVIISSTYPHQREQRLFYRGSFPVD